MGVVVEKRRSPAREIAMLRQALSAQLALGGVDGFLEARLRLDAYKAIDDLAAFEDHERRDAAHAVVLGGAGSVVDVEFDDLCTASVLAGELLNHRGDLAAGTAPRSPKI